MCFSVYRNHWTSYLLFYFFPPFSYVSSSQAVEVTNSDVASSVEGEMYAVALTMMQSAFRGHLARCRRTIERWLTCTAEKRNTATEKSALHKVSSVCVCVCVAQDSLCLLHRETVCQRWCQEDLVQHAHTAEKVCVCLETKSKMPSCSPFLPYSKPM